MKSFKQILNENHLYIPEEDTSGPVNLDEELKDFDKVIIEDGVGYINNKMSIKMKHEQLHEWVMASGYLYQTKSYRPGVVTEHVYTKHDGLHEHNLTIVTKGDQRDVWQVIHNSTHL